MCGVFAEFERSMIRERVMAGLDRAKKLGTRSGRAIGRPKVAAAVENAVRARLAAGEGILKVAKGVGVGVATVQRVKREMAAPATT
jgi:DNA invertase Pin-like site-specific DNA recombinase